MKGNIILAPAGIAPLSARRLTSTSGFALQDDSCPFGGGEAIILSAPNARLHAEIGVGGRVGGPTRSPHFFS
ncbi:protein of unknown function [Magnetospirillum sp. XM-1]|nr:protein of unknown function [Magnetospirillum sp. XM-1]